MVLFLDSAQAQVSTETFMVTELSANGVSKHLLDIEDSFFTKLSDDDKEALKIMITNTPFPIKYALGVLSKLN